MNTNHCWSVVDNPLPQLERPTHINGDTLKSCIENWRLEHEYRKNTEDHKQRSCAASAIICATLTPIAETYVKGMAEPLIMWNALRERLSSHDNISRQQSLHIEFDLLMFYRQRKHQYLL